MLPSHAVGAYVAATWAYQLGSPPSGGSGSGCPWTPDQRMADPFLTISLMCDYRRSQRFRTAWFWQTGRGRHWADGNARGMGAGWIVGVPLAIEAPLPVWPAARPGQGNGLPGQCLAAAAARRGRAQDPKGRTQSDMTVSPASVGKDRGREGPPTGRRRIRPTQVATWPLADAPPTLPIGAPAARASANQRDPVKRSLRAMRHRHAGERQSCCSHCGATVVSRRNRGHPPGLGNGYALKEGRFHSQPWINATIPNLVDVQALNDAKDGTRCCNTRRTQTSLAGDEETRRNRDCRQRRCGTSRPESIDEYEPDDERNCWPGPGSTLYHCEMSFEPGEGCCYRGRRQAEAEQKQGKNRDEKHGWQNCNDQESTDG